jgi:D-sedoheptulose 7-phosphate isomerase
VRHHNSAALVAPPPAAPVRGDYQDAIVEAILARRALLAEALEALARRAPILAEVADRLVVTLRDGGRVLVAGNGGSAAEAQHFAAELVGRFKRERAPYAVLSLTADTATLTALANDYGYATVFTRQVRALGQRGDLFLAYSTSGESENVVHATLAAREQGMGTVAVTADRPSRLERAADLTVRVPVADTAAAQELHMMVTHILCDLVEATLANSDGSSAP